MLVATLVFSVAYIFVKRCTMALGFWEAAFFRGLGGFLILTLWLSLKKEKILGNRKNWKFLFIRGFSGAVAMILYFWALSLTTMGNAAALHYTHPLFTTILAIPLLGEEVTWKKILLIFIALSGVFLILRIDSGILSSGSLLALGSGFLASIAYLSIRHISQKENPAAIINWLCILTMFITFPPMLKNWVLPSFSQWNELIVIGVLTTVAQGLMTLSYKLEKASTVAAFSFTGIIWATIAGKLVFAEIPDLREFSGIFIIFFSMAVLVVTRNSEEKLTSGERT